MFAIGVVKSYIGACVAVLFAIYVGSMEKADRTIELQAIGARVRQLRREKDMTQEELAERAGLSKSFVSEIEGGRTAASGLILLKIAQAAGVSVEWLLTGELPTPPAIRASDVEIPPLVAELAEEHGWSYSETLDIAAALQTVVARRTRGARWQPGRDELLELAKAVRQLRPPRGDV